MSECDHHEVCSYCQMEEIYRLRALLERAEKVMETAVGIAQYDFAGRTYFSEVLTAIRAELEGKK